jgi:hypothetical protein
MGMSYKDQLGEKIKILEELVRRSRDPLHLAALANAYVLDLRYYEAGYLWDEVSEKTKERDNPAARCIYVYCQIYIALRKDLPEFYELMKQAAALPCKASLRRWLPLPLIPKVTSD